MRLSLARLADLVGEDVREVKKVDASKKGIQSLDDLRYDDNAYDGTMVLMI